jgi:hypothetical protein
VEAHLDGESIPRLSGSDGVSMPEDVGEQ